MKGGVGNGVTKKVAELDAAQPLRADETSDQGADSESLLRIEPIRRMLADTNIRLCARPIDNRWRYERIVPFALNGFCPFAGEIYYAARSKFAQWLVRPGASARPLNERDILLREALFLAHDYLHAWSYARIRDLVPRLGFGTSPITARNFEAMVFCHLLTEAAATVGVDYWYLATVDLNKVADIGTTLVGLTAGYHERHLDEYRRFCPSLTVQEPAFFERLARFYCTGRFRGFFRDDLRRSPILLAWLEHELRYGGLQRDYTRSWFAYLSKDGIELTEAARRAPVACDDEWQRDLMAGLGAALWAFVVEGSPPGNIGVPRESIWASPEEHIADFRFVNLASFDEPAAVLSSRAVEAMDRQQTAYLMGQYLVGFGFDAFDPEKRARLPGILEAQNIGDLLSITAGETPVDHSDAGPRDMLFLN
jgi:hypothetical protein